MVRIECWHVSLAASEILSYPTRFFYIRLNEPAPLEIVFIDDRRRLRQVASLLEQSLDILTDEVRLEVDRIVDLLEAEGRHLGGVGNDGNAERMVGNFVDG